MTKPKATILPGIDERALEMATAFSDKLKLECDALLPGFFAVTEINGNLAVDLVAALDAVEADKLHKEKLSADLANVRQRITAATAEIDEIHKSGARDDTAAGRVGLLQRDIAEFNVQASELEGKLAAAAPTANPQERAWAAERSRARAEALSKICTELERRIVATATGLKQSTPISSIGLRWRPCREIKEAASHGVF